MSTAHSTQDEETLDPTRRRIGLLVTLTALAVWAVFAVKQFTKAQIEFPAAPASVQRSIRCHIKAQSRRSPVFVLIRTSRDPGQGRSK